MANTNIEEKSEKILKRSQFGHGNYHMVTHACVWVWSIIERVFDVQTDCLGLYILPQPIQDTLKWGE
jgi:hypothetical protein